MRFLIHVIEPAWHCAARAAGPSMASAWACSRRAAPRRHGRLPATLPAASVGHYKVGSPYKINGRWYRPEYDPNYVRVGTASWYGADFHGLPTANGEVFDKEQITAAHPTLPLPSIVRVTNLENGRSIEVRVNDRGPFVGDRLIDLSQAAARKLGYESSGLAPVRVEFVGLADADGTPPAPTVGKRSRLRLRSPARRRRSASCPSPTPGASGRRDHAGRGSARHGPFPRACPAGPVAGADRRVRRDRSGAALRWPPSRVGPGAGRAGIRRLARRGSGAARAGGRSGRRRSPAREGGGAWLHRRFLVPATGKGGSHAGELLSPALATKRGERCDCGWCSDWRWSSGLADRRAAQAFETAAKAAIILDNRTGVVLFEKNADERLPPASMSKLMTAYMIFDQLKGGRLKLDDEVLVSERAWKMGGSQMFVKVGDRVKVEDLIRGIIIQSGNDACVTMAEAIAGSEEEFARQMTEKAKEIGPDQQHVRERHRAGRARSPHDRARSWPLLARRIIADFPEYFKYYSEREFEYGGIRQPNRNPLLQAGVPGVDGMKTGFTDGSGYGLVATAKRDDRRVITVMAGLQSAGQRRTEGERLLEYGFREFQEYRLFTPGAPVAEADVWQGVAAQGAAGRDRTRWASPCRAKRARAWWSSCSYPSPLPAPIAPARRWAMPRSPRPGMAPLSVPLVTASDVARAGVLARTTGSLSYLIWGAPAG